MYCLKTNNKENSLSIILEGSIESEKIIQNELENIIQKQINNTKKIIIDFEHVESMSTQCYVMLQKLKDKYPIKIKGQSLYIGSKLKEYNLI